jgi:hypothetical protein
LFIKYNPVASFWFGREAEKPKMEEAKKEEVPAATTPVESANLR